MFNNDKLIDSLKKEMEDIKADNARYILKLDEKDNLIETLYEEKKKLTSKNTEYKKDIDFIRNTHKADLEKIEKSVHYKVNTTLASMGVETFVSDFVSVNNSTTDIQIYNQFMSLEGTEKTEYYNKNREAITRTLLSSTKK